MKHSVRTSLAVKAPFELPLALQGHGWIWLAPHRFDATSETWTVPLRLEERAVLATVRQQRAAKATASGSLSIRIDADRRVSSGDVATVRQHIAHMLRLKDDLGPFWELCKGKPRLHWAHQRGGGRLLRSPGMFEDLLKILFTTNCTWAATTSMTQKLVDAIGMPAPGGMRAFPTAHECDREASFFRDVVRAGYRADACVQLAQAFVRGALRDEQFADTALPTPEFRKRLLALRGFGPYAAGQALRLCSRFDDLALDSWCRAQMATILERTTAPNDTWFARRYEGFGHYAGLAMWCELTASWHCK